MAENLKYGGVEKYNWQAASTACPSGWQLPGGAEWESLIKFVGSDSSGIKLRYNGTNNYGFSAIIDGNISYWWGSSGTINFADCISMTDISVNAETCITDKTSLHFVRCMQNDQKCNGIEYDLNTHGCVNGAVRPKCPGGNTYNPATYFCFEQDPYPKCNDLEYNPNTQRCENGVLQPICDYKLYDTLTQFCSAQDNKAYDKCGGLEYNTITHLCDNGVVQTLPLCGAIYYNNAIHFCSEQDSKVYDKCNGSDYNTDMHFCDNGVVQEMQLCGEFYYGNTAFCDSRDDKLYRITTIGTQIWMAENLNYDANGSFCYGAQDSNCAIYGRLYNWATAMAGVCPEGWHLPSEEEWEVLMNFVQTSNGSTYYGGNASIAGKYLKATSGWNGNGNGQDTYGFAALPGGYSLSGGFFYDVGNYGYWWSASEEYNSSLAYYWRMFYNIEYAEVGYSDNDYLRSVRCIQN
jgi:uncharacterized protein (TIGR02145 family)